jgi:isocitrate dehydrogenase
LRETFTKVATALRDNEATIVDELLAAQGLPQDVGGYYQPVAELADKAMRPSGTLNAILNAIGA